MPVLAMHVLSTPSRSLLALSLFTATLAAGGLPARAEEPATGGVAPAVAEPDVLVRRVDPYDPAQQRSRFLQAAGVDSELDAREFEALPVDAEGFRGPFDQWKAMIGFDRNSSGTLDWFEADAYRRDIRSRALAAFDRDQNGRLTGPEREEAAKALAQGKLPAAGQKPEPRLAPDPAPTAPNSPRAGFTKPVASEQDEREVEEYWRNKEKELRAQADANGDGNLSDAERDAFRKSMEQAREQRILDRFDADGDGKLSEDERKAVGEYLRQRGEVQRKAYIAKFDKDGDGKLNGEEESAARQARMDEFLTRRFDKDGDGKLNDAEAAEKEKETARWREERERNQKEFMKRFDKDGDGQLSEDERRAVGEDFRGRRRLERFDADGDGKLNEAEQQKADEDDKQNEERREAFRKQMLERFDKDKDGQLSDEERREAFRQGGFQGGPQGGPQGQGQGGPQRFRAFPRQPASE